MKILRMIYDWPPPWDGLAPGPFALTRAQAKLGNKITVICGGGSLLFKKRLAETIPGVRVVRLARTLPRVGPFFTTAPLALLAYFFYKVKFRPQIIHGHGHITLWFNVYRLFFGWLDKTPYVLHFHNTAAGRENKVLLQGQKIPILTRFVEWPLHKFSDFLGCIVAGKLVFVSEETAEEAKKYYKANPSKIVVLENGVDCEIFSPEGSVKKEFKTGKTLIYVGALTKRKRVDLLIKSLKLLNNVNLAVIGPGVMTLELNGLVESLELASRVNILGYMSNNQTAPYFRGADLAVFPSSYEGFPKVVLEALACGTPVLASGFTVDPPVSGLTINKFETADELALAVKMCLDQAQKVDVAEIKNRFDWSVLANKLGEIYDQLS